MTVVVLIPSYHRPESVGRVVESLNSSTDQAIAYVISEPDDHETQKAAIEAGAVPVMNSHSANYAGAINTGYDMTDEQYLFAGADDLAFHDSWLDRALSKFRPSVDVVGTNDLLNPYVAMGVHATHYMFRRSYIEKVGGTWEKGPGIVMYEELDHQFVDTAFVGVARARGVFVPAMDSVVEHLHFTAGKSEHDETYERAYRNEVTDRATYLEKKAQWEHLLPNDGVL